MKLLALMQKLIVLIYLLCHSMGKRAHAPIMPNSLGASTRLSIRSNTEDLLKFKAVAEQKYGKCDADRRLNRMALLSVTDDQGQEFAELSASDPGKALTTTGTRVTLWAIALDAAGKRTCSEGIFLTPRIHTDSLTVRPRVIEIGEGLYKIWFPVVSSFTAKLDILMLFGKTEYASVKPPLESKTYMPRTATGLTMNPAASLTTQGNCADGINMTKSLGTFALQVDLKQQKHWKDLPLCTPSHFSRGEWSGTWRRVQDEVISH
jgi:hypothetical protein